MQRLTVAQFKQWLSSGDLTTPTVYAPPHDAVKASAQEIGVNLTDQAIQQAADLVRVNNADPIDAVHHANDHEMLAAAAEAMEDARKKGLGDAWTSIPAPPAENGEAPVAGGEQPAGPVAEVSAEPSAPVVERPQAEPAPSEAEPEVAEPELSGEQALTTAHLRKFAKKLPSLSSDAREPIRQRVNAHMQRMAEDGRKLAEHCLETGGKFSLRG